MNKSIPEKAAYVMATVFGAGYLPIAPGTWGSLAALPVCALLQSAPYIHAAVFAAVFASGVAVSGIVEAMEGCKDPSKVVIDEFAGMLILYFGVPFTLPYIISGFLLYRLFDIIKPFPARRLEKLRAGWGIMLDDLVAAVYANIILQIARVTGLF